MEEQPLPGPKIHFFSYLKDGHVVVKTGAVRDAHSLCRASNEDLKTFLIVNCNPQDRAMLNVSSMTKMDLLRHAAAILCTTAFPPSVQVLLSPLAKCTDQELLMLAARRRIPLPRKNVKRQILLLLVMQHTIQEPVVVSKPGEIWRRNATERCLDTIQECFEDARFQEECKRFLDWTRRDFIAHKDAGLLLDRIVWLEGLNIPFANECASYLRRHVIPFLMLRPSVLFRRHACWEALHIDRMLQLDVPVAKEVDGGVPSFLSFFQRVVWTDASQLREPQRLALEALRAQQQDNSPTAAASLIGELVQLRQWFASRVLHATYTGGGVSTIEQQEMDRVLEPLKSSPSGARLSALPKMIVLPTGVGKSGVICLAPFVLIPLPKRVLVVCPSIAIREQMVHTFTEFYRLRAGILSGAPRVLAIDSGIWSYQQRSNYDVYVATFHAFGGNALLSGYPRRFFDAVLVDEAHHAESHVYKLLREHFVAAQFVYFTGTPYRSDQQTLRAEAIYSCTMREALEKKFVKRLHYLPLPVQSLTVRHDSAALSKTFGSFEEVVDNAHEIARLLKNSMDAKSHVIGFAIWKLKQMRRLSEINHQAILQASDTSEAAFLAKLWETHPENKEERLSIAVVHSDLAMMHREKVIEKLKSGLLDAIVHVNTIGEGFDHSLLSLCCIFKRFSSMAPVVQLLGRISRRIPNSGDAANEAFIIAHPGLGFRELWKKYQASDEDQDGLVKKVLLAPPSVSWTDLEETIDY